MRRNSSAALCCFRPLVGSLLLFISLTSIALAQETGTVTGTVTEFAYRNTHVLLYLDVKSDTGETMTKF